MTMHTTHAPVRPFLNWPVATNPRTQPTQVALLGLPHSEPYPGNPHPNDQARAPDAIRWQSGQFCDGQAHWDFDLGAELSSLLPAHCVDYGNMPWTHGSYDEHAGQVTELLAGLWGDGAQVFILGGDHGVTIPALDALAVLQTPVHILHIDAHLDWRAEVNGVRRGYSSPLRWASEKPWISGMTQIGMRGTGSARREEFAAAQEYGSRIFTAEQLHAAGIGPVLETIPKGAAVYITVDADGLDPSGMPGVLAPSPGGLRFDQIAPLLRAVSRDCKVVGMDVVEVAPGFDASNAITCITAGRMILNVLGASWGEGGAYNLCK
ncbi:arginase family protein [Pseudomonas sp. SDO55104_S430]